MGEKKTLHIVTLTTERSISLIKELASYPDAKEIVMQKEPWYLPESTEVSSIHEIPFSKLDSNYGISCYKESISISATFSNTFILFDFSQEVDDSPSESDYSFIKKCYEEKVFLMAGFETEIFIDTPFLSIINTVKDKAFNPVIILENGKKMEYCLDDEWSKARLRALNELIPPLSYKD